MQYISLFLGGMIQVFMYGELVDITSYISYNVAGHLVIITRTRGQLYDWAIPSSTRIQTG